MNHYKAQLMDEKAVNRALMRISHEIIEKNQGTENLCLVGIMRRGVTLAQMIAENIRLIDGSQLDTGTLDITLYRDDLTAISDAAQLHGTSIHFPVTGKKIILVDDVLYTGRTIRAAIEGIFTLGRPAEIQLAVLIDRGHRELPIRADYVGKNIPTSHLELVAVNLPEYDGKTSVELYEQEQHE